jgi:hypothetical protein
MAQRKEQAALDGNGPTYVSPDISGRNRPLPRRNSCLVQFKVADVERADVQLGK